MSPSRRLPGRPMRQLVRSPLAACVRTFARYLGEPDCAWQTTATYLGYPAHFGRWMNRRRLKVRSLYKDQIAAFLDGHLPPG